MNCKYEAMVVPPLNADKHAEINGNEKSVTACLDMRRRTLLTRHTDALNVTSKLNSQSLECLIVRMSSSGKKKRGVGN